MPCYSTFNLKVVKAGNEKLHSTGVKRVANEFSTAWLPLMIFKTLKKPPKGKFPLGMVMVGLKGATTKQTFMVNTFILKICKRRPWGFFNTGQSLLLMDPEWRYTRGTETLHY